MGVPAYAYGTVIFSCEADATWAYVTQKIKPATVV